MNEYVLIQKDEGLRNGNGNTNINVNVNEKRGRGVGVKWCVRIIIVAVIVLGVVGLWASGN